MRTPVVATPGADTAARRLALPRPLIAVVFAAGILAAILALPALVAAGMGLLLDGRVMPGVNVAGVDVGLLTAPEAEARLRDSLPDLSSGDLAVTLDGVTTVVPYHEFGRDHDFEGLVTAALAVGRSDDPWQDGQQRLAALTTGTDLPDAVAVDPNRFDRLVVETASRAFARPRDAAVVISSVGTYSVVPPSVGRRLHPEEIRAALESAVLVPREGGSTVALTTEVVPFTVSQHQAAEAAASARAMIAAPLEIVDGSDRYALAVEQVQAAIRFGPADDEPYGVILDRTVLGSVVAELAEVIHRAPVDAAFSFDAAGPTGVVAAIRGRGLNVDATVDAIVDALHRRGTGGNVPAAILSASFVEPTLTTAAATEILPDLVSLSSWTTWYVSSDGNGYGANISIPAMDLDGMVILPGQEFDFWRDIGPVTFERGYTYGGAIIGGRSTGGVALAGGICSTSTTLFNTALRAGLQMGDRMNHHYYIDRYPVGLDATVFATDYFSQSMSFTNDTEGPLIIRSYASPGMVRFDLWGLPTNRVVTFSSPVIWNRAYAGDVIEYSSSTPTGTSARVEYPHNGFEVTVTRTVRDQTTDEVIHTEEYYSNYATVDGVTVVGTG
jgi:vancomycin resistance protein YoaR